MHDPDRISLRATIALLLLASCGGDGDGDTLADTGLTDAEPTATASSSSTTDTTGGAPNETSTSVAESSSSTGTGGVPNACDAPPPASDPCLTCGWEQCADPYVACCELSEFDDDGTASGGCLPLVGCALATGCVHASCYQPDTCMAEVDAAGGITGDGTAAAGAFGDCLGAAVAAAATDACAQCQAMGG